MAPRDVCVPLPCMHDSVPFCGQRNFADVPWEWEVLTDFLSGHTVAAWPLEDGHRKLRIGKMREDRARSRKDAL